MSICAYLLSLLLSLCVICNVRSSCVFQDSKYDLSTLDRSSGWPVSGPSQNGTLSHYEISLCRPLNYTSIQPNGCSKSSVCLISGKSTKSFGNAIENSVDYTIAPDNEASFTLFVRTQALCKKNEMYRASIYFSCGPHLGAPKLVISSECQVHFSWRTSAACVTKPKNKEIPCYVLDDLGKKRDLTPLIRDSEGYLVYSPNSEINFLINVCSGLTLHDSHINYPQNVSACRVTDRECVPFGSLSDELKFTSEGLVLTYKTQESDTGIPKDCQLKPKTTIFFKCPVRGYSHPPKLISDLNCQYEVEWETEFACPEDLLKGDIKSCQFTQELHNVEIDLSPLRNVSVYNVFSSETSTYFNISVCSGLKNLTCGERKWKSISVCVHNNSSTEFQVGGTTDSAELLYADGEVTLKYFKGDACNGTNQMSVINFVCDENASNNGVGEPQHVASHDCNHIFKWHTKYACLKHPLDTPCSVTYDKKTVNLQKLFLTEGEPWEATDGRTLENSSNAEYFINVCGQVSKLGNFSMCGEGSSACVLNEKGNFINLGNFTSPPVYDQTLNAVRLQYIGGSSCKDNKLWQSSIIFKCKLGQINSKPVLTRIDEIECRYEFEWQTADACPTGVIEGSDCKVFDSNLDIRFDLSPLKSKVYKVDSPSYDFYLSVCEPVKDSPCTSQKDVGVCQVDKSNHTAWKAGESTSHLSYTDGVVNLTYLSGDPYNDQNHTARMTIIIFICEYNSGNGNPIFVEAVDFAFVFHWYTDLVCPQSISTECVIHDPFSRVVYDLTGLSVSKKNWKTIINEDNKERQIYLSVCQSLTMSNGCDPSASACLVEVEENNKETVIIPNLGRAVNPPVLQSPGHIILTYTNGDSCMSYGENTTYSTLIHFLCFEDDFQTAFKYLGKVGNCEYSFLWATKAACPNGKLHSQDDCQLTDPDSGFTFDLMPLNTKKSYSVQAPSGHTFQFNICGGVVNGCYGPDKNVIHNISACIVDNNNKSIMNISVAHPYVLSYTVGEDVTLTYKSASIKEPNKKVVIKFPCSNSSESNAKFISEEEGQYVFEVKTPLTCIPEETHDCSVIDEFGHEYDLSPLAKYHGGNWEVSDSRSGFSHLKYHINFCRPLNKSPSYKCPGGASSACQTNLKSDNEGFDLGSQMDEILVSNSGVVIVHYTGGSYCHSNQFRRSTTVNLYCSSRTGELKFLGETPECEYVFSLETPAACPLEASHGENCIVKDPLFGYTFNLNPLKNKNNNYNITVDEYNYVFNVCAKLNGFSNKCSNSSACQLKPKDPNFSKSLGQPSDTLVYRNGLITLEYKSGSGNCHGKYNRTTKITFTCHHAHEDKDGPIFIDEFEDCTYLFHWPTVHACPPFDVIECSVVDNNGVYYDLSRLSLPNENYYVKYPFSNKTFAINMCRSVVHTPNSLCPYTSAACLVDSSSKFDSVNLGVASHPPYFEDGKIKISYTSGDPCDEGVSSARFMQTIIEFACDPALIDSEPIFIGKVDCTYYFEWHTVYACPPKIIESQENCTVTDPFTGYLFNFSSLSQHSPFVYKKGDHQYYLTVCGNDNSNPCGPGVGMCQEEVSGEKRHWNGGMLNTSIILKNGVLLLNYTSGDTCHGGLYKRNTLIEFHCGPDIGEPEFLYESYNCTYFFSWKTELACQNLMHCAIKNGSAYYDLTTVAESYHTAASIIMNDNASYYVSVCNSLAQIAGVSCPPGAAICRVSKDSKTGASVAESLGKVEHPPFIDFMGHATAIFTNGSTCVKNAKYQNRARIIFFCDSDAGMGEPVLIDYTDDCFFLFEWRTNIVCPEKPEEPSSFLSCNYTDNSRGIHFDLLPLQKTGTRPYYEVSDGPSTLFKLNICSPKLGAEGTKCNDSAGVCGLFGDTALSYGVATSQKFRYSGGRLILTFYDGDDCPSGMHGKKTSEIIFTCDPAAGIGEPTIYKKYSCLVVFMWKTSLVCLSTQNQCDFVLDGQHYDFNLLSSLSHNWMTSDKKNNTYWINLCHGIRPTTDTLGCSPSTAVCMSDKNGYHMSLGMVQNMKIKSINTTNLLLTFNNGDTRACASVSSSFPLHPVTRLFMQCGKSLGHPRMFSGPDDKCYYDFVWETTLACADMPEEVMVEKDGIIKDSRLEFSFNIKDILNKTFTVSGNNTDDQYIYKINLNGVAHNSSDIGFPCSKAAVCQTKSNFERDIGSIDTRTFIVRGSELYLVFKSRTKPCGKNQKKDVTTLISMLCSSAAGDGTPEFIYESGNCDYVFEWPTIAVCPDYHRKKEPVDPKPDPYHDIPETHHKAEIAVGIIFGVIAAMIIVFIVIKAERRAIISSRFRSLFGRVSLPYFRYKRFGGERLILVDARQPVYDDDDNMLHC